MYAAPQVERRRSHIAIARKSNALLCCVNANSPDGAREWAPRVSLPCQRDPSTPPSPSVLPSPRLPPVDATNTIFNRLGTLANKPLQSCSLPAMSFLGNLPLIALPRRPMALPSPFIWRARRPPIIACPWHPTRLPSHVATLHASQIMWFGWNLDSVGLFNRRWIDAVALQLGCLQFFSQVTSH